MANNPGPANRKATIVSYVLGKENGEVTPMLDVY